MASLNKVFLIGNCVQKPELKYTPTNKPVTELSLAINSSNAEKQPVTTYLYVNTFGNTAENCARYLDKGSSVYVEGFIRQDSWADKQTGQKRSRLLIQATSVQFLGSPRRAETAPQQPQQQQPQPPQQPAAAAAEQKPYSPFDEQQDIPF